MGPMGHGNLLESDVLCDYWTIGYIGYIGFLDFWIFIGLLLDYWPIYWPIIRNNKYLAIGLLDDYRIVMRLWGSSWGEKNPPLKGNIHNIHGH